MPRKKSIKRTAREFVALIEDVDRFIKETEPGTPAEFHGWLYDHAIVRSYRYLEALFLDALVGAVNQDTRTLSGTVGIRFPRHLSNEVCEYLVVGDGYFDFKGRDGLIRQLRRFVPETHYLVKLVKQDKYKSVLEQLSALRNFTAHSSAISKARAKAATRSQRLRCAGIWVQSRGRFTSMSGRLIELAREIEAAAPY